MGISGFVGADGRPAHPLEDPDKRINPLFRGWAGGYINYLPAPGVNAPWNNPQLALGPVTGDHFHIVSLGDLDQDQISQQVPPGQITLTFNEPNNIIRDVKGYDFAVFENAFVVQGQPDPWRGYVNADIIAELAYVEVSSDGLHFARFPPVSLTPQAVGPYGTVRMENVFNLAGKHPNAAGLCLGTPFDLRDIADDPLVAADRVDPNNIRFVRLIDIPGSGHFQDQAQYHIDPNTCPYWKNYPQNHPIYDAWVTWGSGGFDLEAIGVLTEQQYPADINLDGMVDMYDLHLFSLTWLDRFGRPSWIDRCDLAPPIDMMVNGRDFAILAQQWLKKEKWRR